MEIGLLETGKRLPIGWSIGTTDSGRQFFTEEASGAVVWDKMESIEGVKPSLTTGTAGTALRQLALKCEGSKESAVEDIAVETVAALLQKTARLADCETSLDSASEKVHAVEANKNGISILKSAAKSPNVVPMMIESNAAANITAVLEEKDPTMVRLANTSPMRSCRQCLLTYLLLLVVLLTYLLTYLLTDQLTDRL